MIPDARNTAAGTLASELDAALERLRNQSRYRTRTALDGPLGAALGHAQAPISFASNDYLGLAADPRIVEAAREGAAHYGVGAGASHLLFGHSRAHQQLEETLAEFVGYPRALLFSCGYMANLGVVTALCGRDHEVFADKLNHASLNDAMLLSRARFRRYAHADPDALETALKSSRARRKLVVTDAVFSMDGDIAPLPAILALCERYDAYLYLDDAHGFGVLGAHGEGTLAHFAMASERVIYMATLGKAAGVSGAFVAAQTPLTDYLVNRARTYIYTTAQPPLIAHALVTSLAIVKREDWRRTHLRVLIEELRANTGAMCGRLMPSSTAIQPLLLGAEARALEAADALRARGLLVPAIRPPTVPQGSARLRISLSAAHRVEDVRRLAGALSELGP